MKKYLVGIITAPHGLKGDVKVKVDSSFDRFQPGSVLYIEDVPHTVERSKPYKQGLLVKFHGITRDLAETLHGNRIYTEHHDTLAANEYYYEELIGKAVCDEAGLALGVVENIREVPQGVLLEVKGSAGTFLVPFVDFYIKDVNEAAIVIHVEEGLL